MKQEKSLILLPKRSILLATLFFIVVATVRCGGILAANRRHFTSRAAMPWDTGSNHCHKDLLLVGSAAGFSTRSCLVTEVKAGRPHL